MVSASRRSRGGTQTGNTVVSFTVNCCSGERCLFLSYAVVKKTKNKNTTLTSATFKENDRSLRFWNEISYNRVKHSPSCFIRIDMTISYRAG